MTETTPQTTIPSEPKTPPKASPYSNFVTGFMDTVWWICLLAAAAFFGWTMAQNAEFQATDTPLLMDSLVAFCGSKAEVTSAPLVVGLEPRNITIENRKQAVCGRIMEELGKRNVSAVMQFGNVTKTINFNETTLEQILAMG